MAKICLLKHYGSLGPGAEMIPALDEVATTLVRRGIAEYVVESPAVVPSVPVEASDAAALTRRQAKLQAHGRGK